LEQIKKEDFNSGNLKAGENSDGSSRFNSVNGMNNGGGSWGKDKEGERNKHQSN
jgi:hypothetical protein